MFDEMCAQVSLPTLRPDRWKEQLKEISRSGHQVMVAHYDLARAGLGTIPSGPNSLRISEAMLRTALAGGVPGHVAAWALDRLFLYIVADAYEYSIWRAEASKDPDTDKDQFVEQVTTDLRAYFEQLPAEQFPTIRQYAADLVAGDTDERFEFGLDLIIDGLDRYVTT